MFGPPGAGKGTQAKRIANEFKIPLYSSTAEILRNAIKDKTPLGESPRIYAKGFVGSPTNSNWSC